MKKIRGILDHIFIDGLSGMALGLFATLIIGTILEQLAGLFDGRIASWLLVISGYSKAITGAGIGIGVASKFKSHTLVAVSAAVCGMVGAFAGSVDLSELSAGIRLLGPGEPLGAFIAALIGIELGSCLSGRTKIDIIAVPAVTVLSGCAAGILLSPPISAFMKWIGELINYGVEAQPFVMGVVVSVLMGMALTLPISSAAIGISLGLSGIAAGAAAVGCCSQMIGFACMSFKENKWGGLISQGLGTSMLQMPNIIKNPFIWLPPIITSAILGPVSTCLLKMVNNPSGSGMGTAGLVGQLMGYDAMVSSGVSPAAAVIEIVLMHFIAPGILCFGICEGFKAIKLIKPQDLKLSV